MQPTRCPCTVSHPRSMHQSHLNEAHAATVTHSDNNAAIWIAHANTTQNPQATFASLGTNSSTNVLSLSEGNASTNPVRFTGTEAAASAQPGQITDAWLLYGKYVLLSRANANFYAQPIGNNGCYALLWSETMTSSVDHIPVTVRIVGPSTGTI